MVSLRRSSTRRLINTGQPRVATVGDCTSRPTTFGRLPVASHRVQLSSESARARLTSRYSLASQLFARHVADESGEVRFRQMIADGFQSQRKIVFDVLFSALSAWGIEVARALTCVGRTSNKSTWDQHLPHLAARRYWSAEADKRNDCSCVPRQRAGPRRNR